MSSVEGQFWLYSDCAAELLMVLHGDIVSRGTAFKSRRRRKRSDRDDVAAKHAMDRVVVVYGEERRRRRIAFFQGNYFILEEERNVERAGDEVVRLRTIKHEEEAADRMKSMCARCGSRQKTDGSGRTNGVVQSRIWLLLLLLLLVTCCKSFMAETFF